MKNILITVFIMLFFVANHNVYSQTNILQEEQDFNFAASLSKKGMFDLSALQFLNFAENFPTSPRAPEALFRAAQSYRQIDSLKKAENVYLQLLFKYPESAFMDQAQFNRAEILESFGQHLEAGIAFERVRLFSPKSELVPKAQLSASGAFFQAGDYKRSRDVLFWFLEEFSTHPLRLEARYKLAHIYKQEQQPKLALQELDRIAGERVEDDLTTRAQLLRAQVLRQGGRFSQADSVLKVVVESGYQGDAVGEAAIELARSFQKKGDFDQSNESVNKALLLNLNEGSRNTLNMILADNQYARNNLNSALEIYDSFTKESLPIEKRYTLEFRQAVTHQKAGHSDKALIHFESVLAMDDSLSSLDFVRHRALIEAAHVLNSNGQYQQSLRLLRINLKSSNYQDEIMYQIGHTLEKVQDWPGARRSFSGIQELFPTSSYVDEAQLGIASAYEAQKDYSLARAEYKRYLDQFPGADDVVLAQKKLEYLQKFLPLNNKESNSIFNSILLQNLSGSQNSAFLVKFAEEQIYSYHDYFDALKTLKKVIANGESAGTDQQKLLYLMSLCHSLIAEKYDMDQNASQAAVHRDSLNSIVYVLETNFSPSHWTNEAVYLATKAHVSKELSSAQKSAYLDTVVQNLSQLGAADSLVNDLKYNLAEELYKNNLTVKDSVTFRRVEHYCQQIRQSASRNDLAEKAHLLHAMVYYSTAKSDSAISLLKQFLTTFSTSPKIIKTYLTLAELYEQQNRIDDAIKLYEYVSEQYFYAKDAAVAKSKLCALFLKEKRVEEALSCLDGNRLNEIEQELYLFLPHQSEDESLWLNAEAKRVQGSHADAMQVYRDYLIKVPNGIHRSDALLAMGELAEDMNYEDMAHGFYKELIQTFPDDTLFQIAQVRSADIYFKKKDFQRAVTEYAAIKSRVSGSLLKHVASQEVLCQYKQGNLSRAKNLVNVFKKRYSDKKSEASFLYAEGNYYIAKKDFKNAEKSYKDLSKKYNDFPEGALGELGLGRLYFILNRTDDALKLLTSIPEKYTDPKTVATAYVNLGHFYYSNRQIDNCIITTRKVLELQEKGDEHEQAMRLLVNAYDDVRLWDRAIALAREYVQLYPNSPYNISFKTKIGQFLRKLKEYDRAIAFFRNLKPLVDAETEAEIQYWIAKTYSERGSAEQAITEFLKVKYLSKPTKLPWGDTALYEAGMAYRKLGNLEKAKELLQEVVRSRGAADQIGQVANEKIKEIDAELAKKS